MNEDYSTKLEIAKFAFEQIKKSMELIQSASEFKIGFCWDEVLWVDDEFFTYSDLKDIRKDWMDEISEQYLIDDFDGLALKVQKAIDMAMKHGGHDGEVHKAWCIDQMVRILTEERYEEIVKKAKEGGWDWDEGIAP
jgi:hypothetical protein